MTNGKSLMQAFRPRTLFLAASGVILGSGLAMDKGAFDILTFFLALILAVSVQILSNLANDLGDFIKGTDVTGNRQGPTRAVQSGNISSKEMRNAIITFAVFSAIVGFVLVMNVAKFIGWIAVVVMLGLGALCILAALFYTMGKHAYGYKGWGDFFAFLFFGPVAVIGTYFLHTHSVDFPPVFPSIGLGFISAMILNVNNMRDIENDKLSGKITLAAKLGLKNAKRYHSILTFGVFACFLNYSLTYTSGEWYRYGYVIVFLWQIKILIDIYRLKDHALDPCLRLTSISGFVLSVLFSICINL